jgi:V/A-type H+-transporting ATPase subunit K
MTYLFFPIFFIAVATILTIGAVKKGVGKKKAVFFHVISVGVCMVAILGASSLFNFSKAETKNEDIAVTAVSEKDTQNNASAFGLGLIAAAIVTGLSGIGGGIAVASAAPAAIAATSEDPKAFGKALIFVALGEGIALYGLLVSIMIFNQLEKLVM